MRSTLIAALLVSLGVHLALLFGADLDLAFFTEPPLPPLQAELKPRAAPAAEAESAKKLSSPIKPKRKPKPILETSAVAEPAAPTPSLQTDAPPLPEEIAEPPSSPSDQFGGEASSSEERFPEHMPPRGAIHYRVDSGDSGFEIGVSRHEWEIADGKYRLVSDMRLRTLILSYRIESESIGVASTEGLRPEHYTELRNGKEGKNNAQFDWEMMTVRIGNKDTQPLDAGAQDFLSFAYQLGYLSFPEASASLPVVIGRKYRMTRIEVIGEEKVEVPAGAFRSLHLRAPGAKALDLWLAYDYSMLPVKIRFDDGQYILVQSATTIQLKPSGKPPESN